MQHEGEIVGNSEVLNIKITKKPIARWPKIDRKRKQLSLNGALCSYWRHCTGGLSKNFFWTVSSILDIMGNNESHYY